MITFGQNIIITDLECGETINESGIIIPEEKFTGKNIRPRWGKVAAVGNKINDIKEGDWIYMEHGRWTHGIQTMKDGKKTMVWMVDYQGVLLVSDKPYSQYD